MVSSATDGFKFLLFQNACMVYKHAVVAAFRIYAQHCEKGMLEAVHLIVMEITLLIKVNHGKLMELCF